MTTHDTNSQYRYYYTDPLAAAWMAKNFGMKFYDGIDRIYHGIYWNEEEFAWFRQHGTPRGLNYVERLDGDQIAHQRYYIRPDSLHLLKPRLGDVFLNAINLAVDGKIIQTRAERLEDISSLPYLRGEHPLPRILQRNGIAFMWPESEEV